MSGVIRSTCAVCRKSAEQKCSRCKKIFYCTREHQKIDWKRHSKECQVLQLAVDAKVGRHYIATRKIETGEIILKEEKPLVAGPCQGTIPLCLSCYVPLSASTAKPCDKCGWPLCQSCTTHGPECEFTCTHKSAKVSITEFQFPHPTYRCILVVRALSLKKSNPEAYAKLLQLEDCSKVQKDSFVFEEPQDIAEFVYRFFDLKGHYDKDEITKIAGILQINGHEVPITEPAHVAIYDQSSYFEHNCRANASKSFTNKGGLIIRAAVTIPKGEHISICYTDPLWGVTNRRDHLEKTKFFKCTCERCTDPSELGTMFNSILCDKNECNGCMLPETFLIENCKDLPDYVCNKCKSSKPWLRVEKLMEEIGQSVSNMQKDDPQACKSFLERNSKLLHENHYYKIDVKVALAQIIGQQEQGLPGIDNETLSEKILLCKRLDEFLRILVPAENRIRGLILFELHAAIAEFGRRRDKDELCSILKESKRVLSKAYELLRFEPELLPEGKIALHARKNLQEMEVLLKAIYENMPPTL